MKLKELLHGLDVLELHADEALDITGVQYDSRQVTPGALFVAISGFQTDGHKYIPKAMENGRGLRRLRKKAGNRHSVCTGFQCPLGACRARRKLVRPSGGRYVRRRNHRHERQNDQHVSAEARA